ncbi:MAG: DHH family phosphoesterase [Nitrososphaerota archaeon]|nr:DHH family phosphoesterase [Candidatus Calditenuis fumarioli]
MTTGSGGLEALIRSRAFVSSVSERLSQLRGRKVSVLTHVGGDQDAIAAAFVLGNLLMDAYGASAVEGVHVPGEVSDHSERFASALSIPLIPSLPEADHYVAVDVGSPAQLGEALPAVSGRVTVIDHHQPGDRWPEGFEVLTAPEYKSSSEIVLDLSLLMARPLDAREATALFFGMYYDTVRLTVADALVLRKVGILGEYGAEPSVHSESLEVPPDYSERVARLKGLKRSSLFRAENVIIAVTRVGAFRSSVARTLILAGAGIAVVGDESNGVTDVVFRVSPEVIRTYSVNVVKDVIEPLTAKLGGQGGGHAAAARVRVPAAFDEVVSRCLELLGYALGSHVRPIEDQ